jgi:thiol-disulfide isomerase/thioredoxin
MDHGELIDPDPDPGPGRIWFLLGLIFVLGWCLYLLFFGPKVKVSPTPPDLVGTALSLPADYDWTLHDLEGRPVPFAHYRGKPVLLNIWATWCEACVDELPTIAGLARSPRLRDVAFVCVSIDDDTETVRKFLQGKDWPMTFLHANANELPAVFTAEGGALPATFLIAPDGRIAATTFGSADWDHPSAVEFLEQLASSKPGPALKPEPR